jgi:hypothetical protein
MIDFNILHRKVKSPYFNQAVDSLSGESIFLVEDVYKSQTVARMRAYTLGTGEYVSFCDDDDVVSNLPIVKDYLEKTKAPAIYTNSNVIDKDGNVIRLFNNENYKWNYTDMCNSKIQVHQLTVIRRDVVEEVIYKTHQKMIDLNAPNLFDYSFFFEVAKVCGFTYLHEVCYNWRIWDSMQQLHSTLARNTYVMTSAYLAELELNPLLDKISS